MWLKPRYIPNAICVLRILMVAPIVWCLLNARYPLALLLIVIAGLSDALDGYLARRFDWRTRLGGVLDPAADKFLMVSAFLTLTWIGIVPAWFTAIVVGRDVIIMGGSLLYQLRVGPFHGEPSGVSKLNTVLQILFVVFVLTHEWMGQPPRVVLTVLGALVLVTIVISVSQYVVTGFTRAREAKQA